MKKGILTIFILSLLFVANATYAEGENQIIKGVTKKYTIKVDGASNYPPFSWIYTKGNVRSVEHRSPFFPFLNKLTEGGNIKFEYNVSERNVDKVLKDLREIGGDIFIGALSQSDKFKDVALIYPAPIYNPITVFMMPDKISQVKTIDDLKSLKGVRYTHEVLSDFINQRISQYNIEEVDTPYKMFEKLFKREADYILCGYYFGTVEAIKLGIRHQISTSSKALWNIPVFIGVNKMSKNRKILTENISRLLSNENNVKLIKENLDKTMAEFEAEYKGKIPETFGLDKQ